jgi:hypothetical protein
LSGPQGEKPETGDCHRVGSAAPAPGFPRRNKEENRQKTGRQGPQNALPPGQAWRTAIPAKNARFFRHIPDKAGVEDVTGKRRNDPLKIPF